MLKHEGSAREAEGDDDAKPVPRTLSGPPHATARQRNGRAVAPSVGATDVPHRIGADVASGGRQRQARRNVGRTVWHLAARAGRGREHEDGAYRILPYFSYGPFATFPGLNRPGGVVVPSGEVLRMDFPHPLVLYDAYSPLTAIAQQLEAAEAVGFSAHGMRQGINPSCTVELSRHDGPS